MGAKEMRWIFVALLAIVIILGFIGGPISLGISQSWSNGNYRFAGGTHPLALALAAVTVGLYLWLMYSPVPSTGSPLPGLFRRFIAFFLDFIIAMIVVAPTVGVLTTITEWKRTGAFQWNFERATQASTDSWFTVAGIFLSTLALIPYYAFPLVRGRPSPGACMAGYHVIPDEGAGMTAGMAVSRTLLGFVAMSAWPLALLIARDRRRGKFWLDKIFHTRAVKLT